MSLIQRLSKFEISECPLSEKTVSPIGLSPKKPFLPISCFKKCMVLLCVLLLFSGCSTVQHKPLKTHQLKDKIKIGMNETQVRQIAGEPGQKDDWGKGKFIYYYNANKYSNGQIDKASGLPVFFENNQVYAVGWEMKQALEEKNQTTRQSALLKKKEKMLYEKVKKIPASDYKSNYELYRQLSEINPQNLLYIKKRNNYKALYNKRNKTEQALLKKAKKIPGSDHKANFDLYEKLVQINPYSITYRKKRDYYKAKLESSEKPSYEKAMEAQSCYIIGYRFGRCSANNEKGLPCDQRNIITIPDRCKNNKDTKDGIAAGRDSVK